MATPFYEALGNNIGRQREDIGLTQEALAGKVGMSRPSLANIERGRQRLTVDQLVDIADVMNVSVSTLIPSKQNLEAPFSKSPTPSDMPTVDRWLQVAKRG